MTASAWRLSQRDRIVSDADGYPGAAWPHRICPLRTARIVAGVVGIARHFQTGQQLKADPELRSIKIIAVTSYALSGEEKKARAAGCDDYVPKPFSPRQLLAKIRQYLT